MELRPSYSGGMGGSGNRSDGDAWTQSSGGVLGGSGNRNDGSGSGDLETQSATTSTAMTDSTPARGGVFGGSGN